jgi:DNA-binding transcriptional LysR family regulator
VRLAEAAPQEMGAVRIGDGLRILAVAAPPYLAEREPLVTPEDLRNHRNLSGSFSKADLNLRARYQWLEMPTELDDPRPFSEDIHACSPRLGGIKLL